MRKFCIIAFLMFWGTALWAQVSVIFVPEVNGRNLNGLFNCTIINNSQRLTASLKITVTERSAGTICVVKTPEFDIALGSSNIPLTAARAAGIVFGSGQAARVTSQTRNFPGGDYDYCYELTFRNSDKPAAEQCFSYTLAPFADMTLIEPYDKDKICNKRPVFTWQPLIPAVAGSFYQLVLSEVKAGQNGTEALNYNLPIINQRGVQAPMLPYPSIAKDLETGKKYAWQVTAYKDQTILIRSDVWEFTIDCQDSVKKPQPHSYRDLEDLAAGNYYVANGWLRFAVVNSYNEQKLNYEISALNRTDRAIKRLPKFKLATGRNEIDIDLTSNPGIKPDNYYILTVKLPDGQTRSLRFLYKEPQ